MLQKMSPKPNKQSDENNKVELDLHNYAIKDELKDEYI